MMLFPPVSLYFSIPPFPSFHSVPSGGGFRRLFCKESKIPSGDGNAKVRGRDGGVGPGAVPLAAAFSPHVRPCPTLFTIKTRHKTRSRPLAGPGDTQGRCEGAEGCVGALGTAPFTSQGWECGPLPPNRCALQGQLASSLLSLENRQPIFLLFELKAVLLAFFLFLLLLLHIFTIFLFTFGREYRARNVSLWECKQQTPLLKHHFLKPSQHLLTAT